MDALFDFRAFNRPSSPNSYLVAPASIRSDADQHVSLAGRPDIVFQTVCDLIRARGNWYLKTKDDMARSIHFVAISRLFRFRDDVYITIYEADDGTSDLAIYSRSRVGYSDMGVNKKRVDDLITGLKRAHVKA